jgi:ATP-dependent DNA helicase RecQ
LIAASIEMNCVDQFNPELTKRYLTLALSEIDIGYAGRQAESAEIHRNIADLTLGSPLNWREDNGRFLLMDAQGNVVGRTAASLRIDGHIESCVVSAIVVRYSEDSEEQYRHHNKINRWEVVVPKFTLSDTPVLTDLV